MTKFLLALVGLSFIWDAHGNCAPVVAKPAAEAVPSDGPAGANDPRRFFKEDWDFMWPQLSPDGRRVAFIAVTQDHACLHQIDLASHAPQGLFNPGEGDVERFWWLDDQRILFCGLGRAGRTYYTLNLSDGKTKRLYRLGSAHPNSVYQLPNDGDHIMVSGTVRTNFVDTRNDSIWKYSSIEEKIWPAVWSAEGEVLAGISLKGENWTVYWRAGASQPWQKAESTGRRPVFRPWAMAQDNKHILVIAYDRGDTSALMLLDPTTGVRTLIGQRPDRDVSDVVIDPHSRALLAIKFFSTGQEEIQYLDDAARVTNDQLSRSLPGPNHQILNTSKDGNLCIVSDWNEKAPPSYYLFDRAHRHLSFLGKARQDIDPSRMGSVQNVHFRTRDGLEENGFVMLPPGQSGHAPWPLLVIPTEFISREMPNGSSYTGLIQFFASRGFAVAMLAVRGTDGFGRSFEQAGDFQAADKVIGDFADGIGSMVQSGLVDRDRVAIYGAGFSGALALRSATTPGLFRTVVAFVPKTDFDATDVWTQNSDQIASAYESIQQAGGTAAAYAKMRQFEPAVVGPKLSSPLLLIYPGQFGHEYSGLSQSAGILRRTLDSNNKAYEWRVLDAPSANLPAKVWSVEFETSLYTLIADYLDRALKNPGKGN